ncbi:DNA methyltransferase [Desulfoplanes formicivorans]|uniref:site-specific DNA-methyltransferase (adenine-specific) n=1 Tax=Desulfoplanes formicivorans TaxID=1592317 RepID=A0A194AG87_9BACT|nr:site-specific DNA-methyltransferase [Desulfoplanes formicivorans]GAU09092.1 adenine specific DNA methylase Mod [Desulfoplanes formicivorans]
MPSVEQLRSRLLKKLSELFQLDQPDLDFGFYRIMHAKAQEVQDFISTDLLKIVKDAFGEVDEARKADLQAKIDEEIKAAKEYGVANPENSPKVKEALAAFETAKNTASAEADVYDHLYRFFERYYDDGDFISRRYYTRETSGKAAPYAVPYNGEEVKLIWANMDQYYIKSAEYFSNFTFDLQQAREVQAKTGALDFGTQKKPLPVHFRIVDATEGEHGNVKASDQSKRFFIIHKKNPVEFTKTGELICNFEYRPDPEKTGQEKSWRDKRNAEAVEVILNHLEGMPEAADYQRLLQIAAPTEKDKKRPLLAKYVNQYTARNTMDYFIHKDLGGFLRRELDFYIKNEVMRLDDIENANAPAVESYLAKIKVLRKIATKLIDFLAQLEDFQKKLWLKKKFVVETNYCITLDRVPEELYPEIATNEAQIEEWIKLFSIDEIQADLHSPGFSLPLTVDFLKANNKLVLDTRFFNDSFKAQLVALIENFDEQCDGLLIHSENFQALNLIADTVSQNISNIFIDPPYNTGDDGFVYKDNYQSSSWLTMISDRINSGIRLISNDGVLFASIGDEEQEHLSTLIRQQYGKRNFFANLIWEKKKKGSFLNGKIVRMKDYVLCVSKSDAAFRGLIGEVARKSETYPVIKTTNARGVRTIKAGISSKYREKNCRVAAGTRISSGNMELILLSDLVIENGILAQDVEVDSNWIYGQDSLDKYAADKSLYITQDLYFRRVVNEPRFKRMRDILPRVGDEGETDFRAFDVENLNKYGWGSNEDANDELHQILGEQYVVSYPKPSKLITLLFAASRHNEGVWMDYYAGSGTSGHAVINLNRGDGGKRKYILVEMSDYFDTVLKPRIAKVVYSKDWKDGKPTARDTGISHCFKYLCLESYEDTLNNLRFNDEPSKSPLLKNASLKEDYMLRYLLDVETRGSQSILNIDAFTDPTAYTLKVKKPGTDEYVTRTIDLIETFNYLIGLRVEHYSAPQTFTAQFKRTTDPELPEDQRTRLAVDGRIQQDDNGPWWFRKVEGWVPADRAHPDNGQREKVLIVWRKLTGNIEQDNLMLDEWFRKNRISTRDFEFDTIYVNGSNNLPNLKQDDEHWKVRLIEEAFMKRMWEVEG